MMHTHNRYVILKYIIHFKIIIIIIFSFKINYIHLKQCNKQAVKSFV